VTILRVAGASDRHYSPGSLLVDYDGTYKFNTLADSPLRKGQITARGVFLLDSHIRPVEPPITFAITGVPRARTPQLMERLPRASLTASAGSSILSCKC
jgi:hypothetical protein